MPRLAEIFLRDLELNRFACLVQGSKQWRSGLTNLEIDRSVLNLNDDVIVELAIEFVEVIVGGAGAIVFRIFGEIF